MIEKEWLINAIEESVNPILEKVGSYDSRIFRPYDDEHWNLADTYSTNGLIWYDKENDWFRLEGEIQLIELLTISICKYAVKDNSFREKLMLNEVDLSDTVDFFHSNILSYCKKLYFEGEYTDYFERFKFSEGKGGRIWVKADEEILSVYTVIQLILRIALYAKVNVWQELNSMLDIEYY